MVHRLHRRMAHLLALPPTRRRLRLRLLAIVLLETDIHVLLNIGDVFQDITDNTHLNRPTEEVELAHRRFIYRRLPANLEADALSAAERVKQPLGIRFELAFIVEMYHELSGRVRSFIG